MTTGRTVAVVLDPAFGDRLAQVARDSHVWITPSAENRMAVEEWWAHHQATGQSSVTLWSEPRLGVDHSDWESILGDVDRHHGEYAGAGIRAIVVFGASLSEVARSALVQYGFTNFTEWRGGFTARGAAA